MSDTTQATTDAATPTTSRAKVSERSYIDASGNEVDRMEQATGGRYALPGISKAWDLQFGAAGAASTMLAIMGMHTKLGNIVNTVKNDKKNPGTLEEAAGEIDEFLQDIAAGIWRESEGAARAPKFDNAILGAALVTYLAGTAKGDAAYYQQRLESDKAYRSKVIASTDVKLAYEAECKARGIAGRPQPKPDELA